MILTEQYYFKGARAIQIENLELLFALIKIDHTSKVELVLFSFFSFFQTDRQTYKQTNRQKNIKITTEQNIILPDNNNQTKYKVLEIKVQITIM